MNVQYLMFPSLGKNNTEIINIIAIPINPVTAIKSGSIPLLPFASKAFIVCCNGGGTKPSGCVGTCMAPMLFRKLFIG